MDDVASHLSMHILCALIFTRHKIVTSKDKAAGMRKEFRLKRARNVFEYLYSLSAA